MGSGGKTFNEKEFLLVALVSFYELSQNTSEPVKVILDKKKNATKEMLNIAILRRSQTASAVLLMMAIVK